MSPPDEPSTFEGVDWSSVQPSRRLATPERLTLLTGLAVLAALYWYDVTVAHVYLVLNWRVEPLDWVFLLSVVVLVAYGVVPAARNRAAVGRVLRRLWARRATRWSGLFLLAVGAVGFFGPIALPEPPLRFGYAFNPPFGIATEVTPFECVGRETGGAFDEQCHGSWLAPLGTNHRGHPLSYLLMTGARVALYVVVVTAAFAVPAAAAVGVVAGLFGGFVDDLLSTLLSVQLSIPAIVLYFVGYAYWGPSLLLLLAAFGLLSWAGIARLVRSETLQRREAGHVRVARSLGASRAYLARRHVLPNVTNTVVPAVFQLFALLIVVEAGIAFLGFHQVEVYSWGSTISESLTAAVPGRMQTRAEEPAHLIWWVSTFPAIALALTVFSLKVVGDGLRDALDPRGGQ